MQGSAMCDPRKLAQHIAAPEMGVLQVNWHDALSVRANKPYFSAQPWGSTALV